MLTQPAYACLPVAQRLFKQFEAIAEFAEATSS
jgi:hypothetical protein